MVLYVSQSHLIRPYRHLIDRPLEHQMLKGPVYLKDLMVQSFNNNIIIMGKTTTITLRMIRHQNHSTT